MSYEIKSTRVDNETLWTEVEYTFADNSKQTIEVAHFMPANKAQIISEIEGREVSEQAKINAKILNDSIKIEIDAEI